MLHKFYIQLLVLVMVSCYATDIKADDNTLIPSTGQKVYVPITATSVKAKLMVSNYGRNTIHDFDYTLSFNENILASKHYTLPEDLNHSDGATIEIDVPPHTELSETNLIFTITKVNGDRNNATFNYATLPRVTVNKVPKRRVVVEDYTAMWCGYCPRGIALVENLANTYADDFIGIVIHSSDPLRCQDYDAKAYEDRNRPSLWMNRNRKLAYYIAREEFESERSAGADMDVDVTAVWDELKNNITVTPSVTFCVNKEEAPYGFTYVLTEDGMSDPSWVQSNNFSQDTNELGISKELDKFIRAPFNVRNLVNNFVAIAAEGVGKPLMGHIKAPIKADQTQSHSYVFKNVSSKPIIRDKAKLKVCVLLINTQTGRIENAAKCSIADAIPNSISSVSDRKETAVETARYTLDGRRITAPQKGINIVKYSDGRVRKEVITQ